MNHNEVQDRRALKTQQAIQDALYMLMQEKQYSKITIQDIIDKANVGRSTFYSHYDTKDDLLISSIDHLLMMLNHSIISYFERSGDSNRIIPVMELFEHIKENSRIMKGLMKSDGADIFFNKVQGYWNKRIEDYLNNMLQNKPASKVPVEIFANHISSTLIHLLKWWVDNKFKYSAEQMERYFGELINPCMEVLVKNI